MNQMERKPRKLYDCWIITENMYAEIYDSVYKLSTFLFKPYLT